MKSFLLLSLIVSAYAQSQDLCGSVPNTGGHRFADDPSSCRGYLWCNYNGENLVSVHQGTCDPDFHFNSANGACDGSLACETNLCVANTNPGETKRIAVAADTQCRQFQVCTGILLGDSIISCTAPAVFNRNFGICTVESIAPCAGTSGGGGGTPGPSCDKDGFVNDELACDKFFFCEGGVSSPETCPPGFHFNTNGNFCDHAKNLNPPCETSTAVAREVFPRPAHINGGIAKLRKIFSKI